MRLRLILTVSSLVGAMLAVPAHATAAAFNHPGVLVSRPQLDHVKANLGNEPWKSAWAALRASSFASLSWTAKPRATVECGPSSNPDLGCSDERKDGMAAYTHALQWYLTQDARYAQKAIQIMDAWSAVISQHIGHNAPLQTGWAGANFSRAAELIKHTYTGWPGAARFATKLRDVYLPTVIAGSPNTNGNWELIMTDAAIGIAVHLDDQAAFDRAVRTWRGRVPAYMYLTTDGALPKSPPGSRYDTRDELIDYWQGQSTFVNGLAQETCRDFGHTGWGIAAAVHVAETARHQGLDLYTEAKDRLRHAMGFHAGLQLGEPVPSSLCGGSVTLGLGPTFEVGFNALRNRMGIGMARTQRLVEQGRPAGTTHFLGWETLTHAENPA
ncbi:Alginate lyase [Nonomuraea solani]|uniref:Alginate lyase n=1 Tax=Nonomuraea solani TaxID=1144553 RepID=A0A1H6EED8_9ACTN|nr:alginate lyase family protein [Nonomuraea solani]SEG95316.1 Alginate lyase [Nonomuraea solani]